MVALGLLLPQIFGSPTPVPDFVKVPIVAPTGWVMAGVLIIILILMLYSSIKRAVVGMFRKKRRPRTS